MIITTVDDVWHGYIGNPSLRRRHHEVALEAQSSPSRDRDLMAQAERVAEKAIPRAPSRHEAELQKVARGLRGDDSDHITSY